MNGQPTGAPVVPFDYVAAQSVPHWRDTLAWPMSFRDAFALSESGIRSLLAWINAIPNEDWRNVALQASPVCIAFVRSMTEAVVVAQRAKAVGRHMVGGMTGILDGSKAVIDDKIATVKNQAAALLNAPTPNFGWLRGAARAASWTPALKLPRALLAPDIAAISHNALLREAARHSAYAIGFNHAAAILAEARRRPEASRAAAPTELVDGMVSALTGHEALPAELRPLMNSTIRPFVATMLNIAAADLAGLAAIRRLPLRLWSGSGGVPAARAIGLEILRRGGEVTRFDHGGCTPMVKPVEQSVLGETSVSSDFGMATERAAAEFETIDAGRFTTSYRQSRIFGVGHDPSYGGLPLTSARHSLRRRVVYAPTILIAGAQYHPPLLPAPVYLDWQLRLAGMLKAMPIELVCQPHPEGIVAGAKHPLASVAPTHDGKFEELMSDADVFVFDYGQSTVVTEAMCSDRIVVLIDFGNPLWTPRAADMVERRCRVIRARFDDRNLPHIETDQLRDAVCGGNDRADPSELQGLLM